MHVVSVNVLFGEQDNAGSTDDLGLTGNKTWTGATFASNDVHETRVSETHVFVRTSSILERVVFRPYLLVCLNDR